MTTRIEWYVPSLNNRYASIQPIHVCKRVHYTVYSVHCTVCTGTLRPERTNAEYVDTYEDNNKKWLFLVPQRINFREAAHHNFPIDTLIFVHRNDGDCSDGDSNDDDGIERATADALDVDDSSVCPEWRIAGD